MRIERLRAIKLSDLPQVPEIMISKFVEQLQKGYGSHLGMNSRAGARGRRNAMPEKIMCPAQRDKILQVLARCFSPDFGFLRSHIFGQRGILIRNDSLGAIPIQLLDHQQVRQYFGNRPALRRRLPIEDIRGNVAQKYLQDGRCLLQQGNGWLQSRSWRKSLHRGPQGGTLIVIPRRPPGKAPAQVVGEKEKPAWAV